MILGLAIPDEEIEGLVAEYGSSPANVELMKARSERYGRSLFVRSGSDALIRVHGVLERQLSYMGWLMGGTLYSQVVAAVEQAEQDPAIRRIVLDIDSPGGVVVGGLGCSERIRSATKPTVAFVTGYACSMAYLLASAAERVVAIPSALVGAIGTIVQWVDRSKAREDAGYTLRVLRSSLSPRKNLDLNTPEGEAAQQKLLDEMAVELLTAIGRYRGIAGDAAAIAEALGAGDAMLTTPALDAGLIDEVTAELPSVYPAAGRPQMGGRGAEGLAAEEPPQAAGGRSQEGHMADDKPKPAGAAQMAALEERFEELVRKQAEAEARAKRAEEGAEKAKAEVLELKARAAATDDEAWIGQVLACGSVAPWLEPVVRAVRTGRAEDITAAQKVLDEAPAGASVPLGNGNRLTDGGSQTNAKNRAAEELGKAEQEAQEKGVSLVAHMATLRRTDHNRWKLIRGVS